MDHSPRRHYSTSSRHRAHYNIRAGHQADRQDIHPHKQPRHPQARLLYKSTFYDQKIALHLYTSHTQRPDQYGNYTCTIARVRLASIVLQIDS